MKNFKENIMRVCKKMKKIISLTMLTIFVFSSAVYSYESALRVPIASKKRLVDLIGLTTEAKLVMEGNAVSVWV